MGQKANPNGMRFGVIRDWKARYFAKDNKQWAAFAIEDRKIRMFLEKFDKEYLIGDIIIERNADEITVSIYSAKPGAVLGQDGANIKNLDKEIKKHLKNRKLKLKLDVKEITEPNLNAKIVANEIAISLENRGSFRMAQKKAIRNVMMSGAKGIKTSVSGRLNGVDMARTEGYSEGVIPLQTLRNDIDFSIAQAHTTYGVLGVKVWISRGEILKGKEAEAFAQKEKTRNDATEKKPFVRKPFQKRDVNSKTGPRPPRTNTPNSNGGNQ